VNFETMVLLRVKEIRSILPYAGVRKLMHMLNDSKFGLPVKIGRDHLFRLLRSNRMLSPLKKKYIGTTNSKHSLPSYPNLLKGLLVRNVNDLWVSDITYIKLHNGKFCYLFLVTEYRSRKIIGWALKDSLATEGALESLEMAIKNSDPPPGFIHHSDHGVQYCCKEYISRLKKYGAIISMTGENHCYDNAVAERVNGILKQEFGLGSELPNIEAARKLCKEGIYNYNCVRLHASLGYQTPDHVMDLLKKNKNLALNEIA